MQCGMDERACVWVLCSLVVTNSPHSVARFAPIKSVKSIQNLTCTKILRSILKYTIQIGPKPMNENPNNHKIKTSDNIPCDSNSNPNKTHSIILSFALF